MVAVLSQAIPDSSITINTRSLTTVGLLVGVIFSSFLLYKIPSLAGFIINKTKFKKAKDFYEIVISPYRSRLGFLFLLSVFDLFWISTNQPQWSSILEVVFSIVLSILSYLVAADLFKQFFDIYLLSESLNTNRKINSEFLLVLRFLSNVFIFLIIAFFFAQLHQFNVIGILTSIGIGGVALALASQKILEQALWGLVLFLDQPFDLDDYLHLPDRTFGRVELIGWRSTRIRISGKGSLLIVPNSYLCQNNIENMSRIKKQISILEFSFDREISDHEKALIRRVILISTEDIFGIDHDLTKVEFNDTERNKVKIVQARVTLFILGSREAAEELRFQLIDVACQKISEKLQEYGIAFSVEEKIMNVPSPMKV
ncbi:MAG: mechanosensitive ion channel family protein [Prochlorotrichaceae cyanobacterium]